MGYKASLIIINQLPQVAHQQLLQQLGFTNAKPAKTKEIGEVLLPRDGNVYITTYNNCTIICADGVATELVEDNDPYALNAYTSAFPNAEVCAMALHSVVNYWAYAVIRGGKKVRARAGSGDGGTYLDTGTPLAAEAELLSKATIDADGQRMYMFEEFDEPLTEDAVGEEFVFAFCRHYLKDGIDEDGPLRELQLQGYSYSRLQYPGAPARKPWWKFW